MKLQFRTSLAAVAALFCLTPFAAHAQAQSDVKVHTPIQSGFYIGPMVTRVSNSTNDIGLFSFLGPGHTERTFGGVLFGGYADVYHREGVGVGFDIRDSILHGNAALLNRFEVGPRVTYQIHDSRFKPFGEIVFGVGTSRSPDTEIHISKGTYGILGGVEYHLHRHVDWRVFEVGYSSLTTSSDGTIGGSQGVPAAKLVDFSTSLVIRFK